MALGYVMGALVAVPLFVGVWLGVWAGIRYARRERKPMGPERYGPPPASNEVAHASTTWRH